LPTWTTEEALQNLSLYPEGLEMIYKYGKYHKFLLKNGFENLYVKKNDWVTLGKYGHYDNSNWGKWLDCELKVFDHKNIDESYVYEYATQANNFDFFVAADCKSKLFWKGRFLRWFKSFSPEYRKKIKEKLSK
jgi:hypothetical protein